MSEMEAIRLDVHVELDKLGFDTLACTNTWKDSIALLFAMVIIYWGFIAVLTLINHSSYLIIITVSKENMNNFQIIDKLGNFQSSNQLLPY